MIAVWLAMVGALIYKHAPREARPLPGLQDDAVQAQNHAVAGGQSTASTRDEWFGIYQEGHKIGHSHRRQSEVRGGYVLHDDSTFTLAMLGTVQQVRASLRAETDPAFALRRFRFHLVSAATSFAAEGEVVGEHLRVRLGGEAEALAGRAGGKDLELPLAGPIYLTSSVRPRVAAQKPRTGDRFTTPVFSPLGLRNEPVTITVEGRELMDGPDGPVEALRVKEEQGGLSARAWLASDGSALREEAALGFTLVRENADVAVTGADSAAPIDLVVASRIPLSGSIAAPRHATRMTLRMAGAAARNIVDDPPRQRVDGASLRIQSEPVPATASLPPPGSDEQALAAYRAAEPFIEADDAGILQVAREIAADQSDSVQVTRRILAWVGDNLEQQPSVTVPSARDVLAARRGDCNEHAVLVAALARAAGIPARVVAGVVYSDGEGTGGEPGFFYHAWNELWLGSWVSVDAIFGQMPADATHIKLLEGGPQHHVALAETVGRLALRVESEGES